MADELIEKLTPELSIETAEDPFRLLADNIQNLAWIARPDGWIYWYNRRWYEYTGTTPQQMEGWGWQSVHDPKTLPAVMENWQASIVSGQPFEMEFPLKGADGQFRYFLTRVMPHRDPKGRIVYWFGTNTDIDDQKKSEEHIRKQQRELADFVENATVGLHWVGPDGIIIWANRCELELLGYGRDEYVGRHIADFHVDQPVIQEILERLTRGETLLNYPARLRAKDSSIRHVLINSCVRFESGEFKHTQCFTRDVTALKIAEDERNQLLESERAARSEAERMNRMKDEFLSTLSHELRTPLNAILGWSQVLLSSGHESKEVVEGLAVIERNARVQTKIIEDLLDMSRIISGKVRLDVQRVDLPTVINAAIESVQPSADAKTIRIQKVVDPLTGPVTGDPGRLQQVIWNLLSNAIRYTAKEGKIQVVLERVNSHLELSVSDNGEGIKPEFLPHVFDRFRQQDASTTRRHTGLGLGLSIVKHLVELHGGTVRARSAGEGKGATFIVTLPLPVLDARGDDDANRLHPRWDVPSAQPIECPDLRGVNVLVVDDEPDARNLVKRVLEDCRAHVTTSASALEALQLFDRDLPDVVVSDIGMPDCDGFQLLQQIRQRPADRGGLVPAVALTAFARSEDRRRALVSGFNMHLPKPVEPLELMTVVARLAGRTGAGSR